MQHNIHITKDHFIYKILTYYQATAFFASGTIEVFILHDDDSETIITTGLALSEAMRNNKRLGIEVGTVPDTELLKDVFESCSDHLADFDRLTYKRVQEHFHNTIS